MPFPKRNTQFKVRHKTLSPNQTRLNVRRRISQKRRSFLRYWQPNSQRSSVPEIPED